MKWSLWRISFSQDLWMKWILIRYCFLPGLTWRENRGAIEVCAPLFLWGRDQADKSEGSSTSRDSPSEQECEQVNSSSSWWVWVRSLCVFTCIELDTLALSAWAHKQIWSRDSLYLIFPWQRMYIRTGLESPTLPCSPMPPSIDSLRSGNVPGANLLKCYHPAHISPFCWWDYHGRQYILEHTEDQQSLERAGKEEYLLDQKVWSRGFTVL